MNLLWTKVYAQGVVGEVNLPSGINIGSFSPGLINLFTNILRLIFVGAGIFAFINLIIAGFQFMTAGGDSKAVGKAWDKIWQSFVGLIIIVSSFALAALFGQLLFNDPGFILTPKLYGP